VYSVFGENRKPPIMIRNVRSLSLLNDNEVAKAAFIRFPIGSNSYEIIITNLDRNIFDVKKIKEIYHLRGGIETETMKKSL